MTQFYIYGLHIHIYITPPPLHIRNIYVTFNGRNKLPHKLIQGIDPLTIFIWNFRCTFATNEHCQDWFRRLIRATSSPKQIEDVFAFAYHAWAPEEGGEEVRSRLALKDPERDYFRSEVSLLF